MSFAYLLEGRPVLVAREAASHVDDVHVEAQLDAHLMQPLAVLQSHSVGGWVVAARTHVEAIRRKKLIFTDFC